MGDRQKEGDPFYAEGILSSIVHTLATGRGDVKARLSAAFYTSPTIWESDFPSHLQEEWRWIHSQLLGKEQGGFRYRVNANLHGKHLKTASSIASRIYDLWLRLHEYCYEEKKRVRDD